MHVHIYMDTNTNTYIYIYVHSYQHDIGSQYLGLCLTQLPSSVQGDAVATCVGQRRLPEPYHQHTARSFKNKPN